MTINLFCTFVVSRLSKRTKGIVIIKSPIVPTVGDFPFSVDGYGTAT